MRTAAIIPMSCSGKERGKMSRFIFFIIKCFDDSFLVIFRHNYNRNICDRKSKVEGEICHSLFVIRAIRYGFGSFLV